MQHVHTLLIYYKHRKTRNTYEVLFLHGLTSIPARISKHMPSKVWVKIVDPLPNFNGTAVIMQIYIVCLLETVNASYISNEKTIRKSWRVFWWDCTPSLKYFRIRSHSHLQWKAHRVNQLAAVWPRDRVFLSQTEACCAVPSCNGEFHTNIHHRGRDLGCLLWSQTATYFLLQSLQCCM